MLGFRVIIRLVGIRVKALGLADNYRGTWKKGTLADYCPLKGFWEG